MEAVVPGPSPALPSPHLRSGSFRSQLPPGQGPVSPPLLLLSHPNATLCPCTPPPGFTCPTGEPQRGAGDAAQGQLLLGQSHPGSGTYLPREGRREVPRALRQLLPPLSPGPGLSGWSWHAMPVQGGKDASSASQPPRLQSGGLRSQPEAKPPCLAGRSPRRPSSSLSAIRSQPSRLSWRGGAAGLGGAGARRPDWACEPGDVGTPSDRHHCVVPVPERGRRLVLGRPPGPPLSWAEESRLLLLGPVSAAGSSLLSDRCALCPCEASSRSRRASRDHLSQISSSPVTWGLLKITDCRLRAKCVSTAPDRAQKPGFLTGSQAAPVMRQVRAPLSHMALPSGDILIGGQVTRACDRRSSPALPQTPEP